MWFTLIIATLFGLSAAYTESNIPNVVARESRVVNGEPADLEKYPFIASLQLNGSHYCSCTILSAYWLLTAAHCVYGNKAEDYKIRVGTTHWSTGGDLYSVESTKYHEGYKHSHFWPNDIAVVKVTTRIIHSTTVGPVSLASVDDEIILNTNESIVLGWGASTYGGQVLDNLIKGYLPVFSDEECLLNYEGVGPSEKTICAGGIARGVCTGDSGGPLLWNGQQHGITSWTRNPCATLPAVFTQVSYYRKWIYDLTGV